MLSGPEVTLTSFVPCCKAIRIRKITRCKNTSYRRNREILFIGIESERFFVFRIHVPPGISLASFHSASVRPVTLIRNTRSTQSELILSHETEKEKEILDVKVSGECEKRRRGRNDTSECRLPRTFRVRGLPILSLERARSVVSQVASCWRRCLEIYIFLHYRGIISTTHA